MSNVTQVVIVDGLRDKSLAYRFRHQPGDTFMFCALYVGEPGANIEEMSESIVGQSVCKPPDVFDNHIGRKMALTSVIRRSDGLFSQHERQLIWNSFWELENSDNVKFAPVMEDLHDGVVSNWADSKNQGPVLSFGNDGNDSLKWVTDFVVTVNLLVALGKRAIAIASEEIQRRWSAWNW